MALFSPGIFDFVLRWVQELQDACLVQEARLDEREARLAEAGELFTKRLEIARKQHEQEAERIRKDQEAAAKFRAEVVEEAVQSQDLCEQARDHEAEIREREAELVQREAELTGRGVRLLDREEQVALCDMEVATREEMLEHHEKTISDAEEAVAARERGVTARERDLEGEVERRATDRVEEVGRDFRRCLELEAKTAEERLKRFQDRADRHVRELEETAKSLERTRRKLIDYIEMLEGNVGDFSRRADRLEEERQELAFERVEHTNLLREAFRRAQRVVTDFTLGPIEPRQLAKESTGHLALWFGNFVDRLGGLRSRMDEVITEEGR